MLREFPYSNFHEVNLDWVIGEVKKLYEQTGNLQEAVDGIINRVDQTVAQEIQRLYNDGSLLRLLRRRYVFLADSYGDYTISGAHYSWTESVIAKMGLSSDVAIAINQPSRGFCSDVYQPTVGTFLSGLRNAVESRTIPNPNEITDIIICAGTNDATAIKYGSITAQNIDAAIAEFMGYVKTVFPSAKVGLGFISTVAQANFVNGYNQTLNIFRECGKHGAYYLKGLEYVLRGQGLADSTGIHPSPEGFAKLTGSIIDAIQSCSTTTVKTHEEQTVAMNTTKGTWNAPFTMKVSMCNDHVQLSQERTGIGLTLSSNLDYPGNTGLSFPYVKLDYGLIPMCTMDGSPVRGGEDSSTYNAKLLGYVPVLFLATNNNYIHGNMPIFVIGYTLYIGVPKNLNNAVSQFEAPITRAFTSNELVIKGITFSSFSLSFNTAVDDFV